jgi:hypothetical protein
MKIGTDFRNSVLAKDLGLEDCGNPSSFPNRRFLAGTLGMTVLEGRDRASEHPVFCMLLPIDNI